MNKCLFIICMFGLILLAACGKKKKKDRDTAQYFPILSFLQSQVKEIDTSLYNIMKIEGYGTSHDTQYLRREEVRKYAEDFLNIPDITKASVGEDYLESKNFDSLMGFVSLSYLSDEGDQEVSRQDVVIIPTFGNNDHVQSIYIEKVQSAGDSTVLKKMLWQTGKYFNIRTIIEKKDKPDQIRNLTVSWQ